MPAFEIISNQGVEEMDINIKDMLPNIFGQRTKKRKMKVSEAFDYLIQEEEQRLIDMDQVTRIAVERVEQSGIIFLDEIDKIAGRESGHGPDVSREGVQRDILPIVEGTTVNTRYGMVRTDHILFIAAGAFHVSKPSDLIPELQGRFPIRVELQSLTMEDFIKILTEPKSSLIKQYTALLETEGRQAGVHPRGAGGDRELRLPGERGHGKHRRAAPAHHHGAGAGRNQLRGAGHERRKTSTSTPTTCARCWPTSSRTRTCRGTSCSSQCPAHRSVSGHGFSGAPANPLLVCWGAEPCRKGCKKIGL